jgi:hypothetical protein
MNFFFNFIIQYCFDWKLDFIKKKFLFYGVIQVFRPEFGRLTWVDPGHFFYPFYLIFFQFNLSTLDWLGIVLHDFFLFSFYGVIMVLWPRSQVRPVYSVFFSFYIWFFFFNFNFHYWVDWELSFIICFDLFSMRLSWSHNLGSRC